MLDVMKRGVIWIRSCPVRPCALRKHVQNCSFCILFESCDTLRSRADILDETKKKFAGKISQEEYELFFRPYEGRKETEKTKKEKVILWDIKRSRGRRNLLNKNNLPKVLKLQKKFPCYNAVHKMGADVGDDVVLVNPSEIVELMKQVPEGKIDHSC